LQRLFIHRFRIPMEWLVRFSWINNLVWNLVFKFFIKDNATYVDDLAGYTFMMDGNRIAKEIADWFGITLSALQQTFVIPELHVLKFTRTAAQMLREANLSPSLFDLLFMPADDFLLSANHDLAGYAVSLAFEDVSVQKIAKLRAILTSLAKTCHEMGGRVYLVKNVFATPTQIRAMFGNNLGEFLTLKKKYDPRDILQNEFFDRLLAA